MNFKISMIEQRIKTWYFLVYDAEKVTVLHILFCSATSLSWVPAEASNERYWKFCPNYKFW